MPSSRISSACNGCRSKKQKCSGNRTPPGCIQCSTSGIECTWPEQKKRGPAKGYIEALESRVNTTETLLLALLPKVHNDVLVEAVAKLNEFRSDREESEERRSSNMSGQPLVNKKTGVEYWESFPLDSCDAVRKWQYDREVNTRSHSVTPPHSRQSSQTVSYPVPEMSNRHSSRSYSRADDSIEAAQAIAGMRHSAHPMSMPTGGQNSNLVSTSINRSYPPATNAQQTDWQQPYPYQRNITGLEPANELINPSASTWGQSNQITSTMSIDPASGPPTSSFIPGGDFNHNLFW